MANRFKAFPFSIPKADKICKYFISNSTRQRILQSFFFFR